MTGRECTVFGFLFAVATTVHPLQIVNGFPTDAHGLPLSLIVTPDESIAVDDSPSRPDGIDWSALTDEDLNDMPVLAELRDA